MSQGTVPASKPLLRGNASKAFRAIGNFVSQRFASHNETEREHGGDLNDDDDDDDDVFPKK